MTANWHGTRHRNLLFSTGFRRVIHQTRDMQLVMGTEREVIRNNKNPWKCCWMRKWWSYSGESDKIALYAILWNSEWERRDSSRAEYKSLNAEGTRDLFELSSFQVAACCIFINPFLPLFSSYLTEMLQSKVDILSNYPLGLASQIVFTTTNPEWSYSCPLFLGLGTWITQEGE